MIIFPAIDIIDNKCVRLTQGRFDRVSEYSSDPVEIAKKWESMGAEYIHVVDLDAAKNTSSQNRKSIENMVKSITVPLQVGGGVRSEESIINLIEVGVSRAIVGTMAIENKDLITRMSKTYKQKLAVSVDALNRKVATRGWQDVSEVDSLEICNFFELIGISTIIYTDISKDGMLSGPNLAVYKELSQNTNLNIIASGGVTTLDDIEKLKSINIYGAIIGKALYDNKLDLKNAITVGRG